MESEQRYVFYEIRPGLDVLDVNGNRLGTVWSLWAVAESGEVQELSIIEGLGPAVKHEGTEVAQVYIPQRGYLIVDAGGLLSRAEVQIPFEAIADVTETSVVLGWSKDELAEGAAQE